MHKLAQRKQFEHCSHSWLLALRCSVAPGVDIPGSGCTTIVAGGAMDSVAMAWPGGAESIPHSCNGATAPYQGHVERYREHVIHTRPCAESASADSQPLGELSALSRFRHPRPGREQRKCHPALERPKPSGEHGDEHPWPCRGGLVGQETDPASTASTGRPRRRNGIERRRKRRSRTSMDLKIEPGRAFCQNLTIDPRTRVRGTSTYSSTASRASSTSVSLSSRLEYALRYAPGAASALRGLQPGQVARLSVPQTRPRTG